MSRYMIHGKALERQVVKYEKKLPEGLDPSPAHVAMLRAIPEDGLAKASSWRGPVHEISRSFIDVSGA